MRPRKLLAWDKPADDATRGLCAGCGREIVRARLHGRPEVLDHPELDHPEFDGDPSRKAVLLDAAGQAHRHRARRPSDARHTLHQCNPNGGSV